MSELDRKILEALKADSDQNWEEYSKEKGLFGLIRESFKGSHSWVVFLAFILIFIFLGLFCYDSPLVLHGIESLIDSSRNQTIGVIDIKFVPKLTIGSD